ncbi:MAG: OmpA family protein [Candidatus Kapabacteria bacterium]|nr:OmpA family protein [Candidatus Kapabacteria bacterium]
MKFLTKLLTGAAILASVATSGSFANDQKTLAIGVGVGGSYGINESTPSDRSFGILGGVYGLFNNGLGKGWTPELALTYYANKTSDPKTDFDGYKTGFFNIDLRLRWEFLNTFVQDYSSQWNPYLLAGVGAQIFTVDEYADAAHSRFEPAYAEREDGGVTLGIPVALGVKYELNDVTAFDLNAGVNFSLSDDFNPVYDDVKDGNWFARLGVHFTIARFAKDTDGDGLIDEEEVRLGTDPNNPDTDGDGLKDGAEVKKHKTNPLDPDTDGGGIKDGVEVMNGADPLDADDDIMNIGVGEKLILRNIEFVTGKADITPKSERILNNALRAMQKMQDTEFEIVGHTDDVGDDATNLKLSEDRAASVKAWLVNRGVADSRLKTSGKGETEPLVPNTNDANRQRNRRVVFYRTK